MHSALPDSLFALTTFDGPVVRMAGFSSPTGGLDRALERLSTNATDCRDARRARRCLPRSSRAPRPSAARSSPCLPATAATRAPNGMTPPPWRCGSRRRACGPSRCRARPRPASAASRREQVVHQGSQMSGGMSETVASAVGLDTMAQRMSALIAKQYVIAYGPGGRRHDSQPPESDRRPQGRARPGAGVEPAVTPADPGPGAGPVTAGVKVAS